MSLKKSVTNQIEDFRKRIFSLESDNEEDFEQLAIEIFHFQCEQNKLYRSFAKAIGTENPKAIEEIPFLPISFFKSHEVIIDGSFENCPNFRSSGTTSSDRSKHLVPDLSLYEESFEKTYQKQIGQPTDQVILALLPNYLEQGESSLVYMVDKLITRSNHPLSGFILHDVNETVRRYKLALESKKKVVVFGVSYALLDLAVEGIELSEAIIIETGGMKGRRKEMRKIELHQVIKDGLKVPFVSSEYGMTELLSQSYSNKDGLFSAPPWMKILIRDVNDPLSYLTQGKTGGINVIDLANLYSCCFIATQDLGKISGKMFSLEGRFDNADIRGCNLLVQ